MDLSDEFVGLRRDDRERFKARAIRALPGIPDAGEGEGSRLGEGDGVDSLHGLRSLRLLRRPDRGRSAEEIS